MDGPIVRHPLLAKTLAVTATVLLLWLALARMGFLVDERQSYQAQAVHSVQQSHAGAQTLLGPLLQRVCSETWHVVTGSGADRRRETQRHLAFGATALCWALAGILLWWGRRQAPVAARTLDLSRSALRRRLAHIRRTFEAAGLRTYLEAA